MRTTKRFTPAVLDRFEAQARGTGRGDGYIPWHRVARGDPSSRGRSHLMPIGLARHLETLSDVERSTALFCTMAPDVEDIREQFPLSINGAESELAAVDVNYGSDFLPGTAEIARERGVKPPRVRGEGRSSDWRMTTDLLLTMRRSNGARTMLAISCKFTAELSRRDAELQAIEEAYWSYRGVRWLLVTPAESNPRAVLTLERVWQWALLLPPAPNSSVVQLARNSQGLPLGRALLQLAQELGDMTLAQAAWWQAVWSGKVPMDLSRGWRPSDSLVLLNREQFDEQNPVISRRSAWN